MLIVVLPFKNTEWQWKITHHKALLMCLFVFLQSYLVYTIIKTYFYINLLVFFLFIPLHVFFLYNPKITVFVANRSIFFFFCLFIFFCIHRFLFFLFFCQFTNVSTKMMYNGLTATKKKSKKNQWFICVLLKKKIRRHTKDTDIGKKISLFYSIFFFSANIIQFFFF